MVLGSGVSSLSFDNSATRDWTGSVLVISNFVSGVVRFGTDATGLTPAQMASISAYTTSGSLVTNLSIDSSGFLTGGAPPPVPVTIGDVSIAVLPGGANLTLTWASTNGVPYVVKSTTNLVSGPWQAAITNIIGNGSNVTVTGPVSHVQSFYRIHLAE